MKKVIIIGAGPSGLVAAKEALAHGLQPIVFEKNATLGGVWAPLTGLTWDTLHTNLSRYTCGFSDFPWPEGTADFPSRQALYDYLVQYATQFQLNDYIRCSCYVTDVNQRGESWEIKYFKDNSIQYESADFLIVASGFFSKPFRPNLPGESHFTGATIHACHYKTAEPFKGKFVVVIGNGYSGVEIASDLVGVAAQVTHLIRTPRWILPKYVSQLPLDFSFYKRRTRTTPHEIKITDANMRLDEHHQLGAMCPDQLKAGPLMMKICAEVPPKVAISEHYKKYFNENLIHVEQDDIVGYQGRTLLLGENKKLIGADIIIFCTGYRLNLSFLPKDILEKISFDEKDSFHPVLLYQSTFCPNIENIAFIGIANNFYFGLLEMQARLAMQVFAGKVKLPYPNVMRENIREEKKIREQQPRPQIPHADYVGLMNDLADAMGVLPDFEKIKKENMKEYDALMNYLTVPAHYRLVGSGANPAVAKSMIQQVITATEKKSAQSEEIEELKKRVDLLEKSMLQVKAELTELKNKNLFFSSELLKIKEANTTHVAPSDTLTKGPSL